MLENAEKALSFVRGLDYDGFCTDDKAVYAVIRALEILGEAARQILEDGPVLQHGLKGLHNTKLILPSLESHHPNREALEWRYSRFSGM